MACTTCMSCGVLIIASVVSRVPVSRNCDGRKRSEEPEPKQQPRPRPQRPHQPLATTPTPTRTKWHHQQNPNLVPSNDTAVSSGDTLPSQLIKLWAHGPDAISRPGVDNQPVHHVIGGWANKLTHTHTHARARWTWEEPQWTRNKNPCQSKPIQL